MHRTATQRSYGNRIEKVVVVLGERLDQPLTLEALAAVGHFSPFHFHRIYRGLMGETVADTLRRMRLHRAAVELLQGTQTLAAIARRCGYGSAAAFNRAFGQAYGCPPGEFRRRRSADAILAPRSSHYPFEDTAMYEVSITQREPVTVAALRHRGPYHDIGQAFERLGAWAGGRGIAANRSFGVYYNDPESKPADELVSDACIEIPDGFALENAGPRRLAISGGRYAVLIHKGPYAELERPYRWLYGEWLPASGFEAADAPAIEEYLNDPRSLPPTEWRTAICLPLREA